MANAIEEKNEMVELGLKEATQKVYNDVKFSKEFELIKERVLNFNGESVSLGLLLEELTEYTSKMSTMIAVYTIISASKKSF